MRARRLVLLVFIAALCVAGLILVFSLHDSSGVGSSAKIGVRINEVMTSNKGAVPDEKGNYPDWVELYNPTDTGIDISGFGLTDDKLAAAKWVFPAGTVIPAKGYVVVFCSGNPEDGPLHAGFRLAATDDLILTNSTGNPVDSLALQGVSSGCTLGLDESGNWVEQSQPSPGYPNTEQGAAEYRAALNADVVDVGVSINEFMASNATTIPTPSCEYAEWIEL